MADIDPAFGVKHKSCIPGLNGKPLCTLGELSGKFAPLRIQIGGASADEVIGGHRRQQDFPEHYGIFIVGEAPGRQEDLAGIPFIGESGKLLHEILEKSGLTLTDTWVTNIVRCKPPRNRDPGAAEIKACLTHLYYEFRRYRPKVVILCGRIALKAFGLDREGGITHVRGKVFERQLPLWPDGPTFQVIPTYHPAYLLYKQDPKLKSRVIQDFELARQVFEGTATSEPIYQVQYKLCERADEVEAAVDEILATGLVAFDTESPDLRFRTSPMITLQLSIGKGKNWVLPFMRHDPEALGEWKLRPQWGGPERTMVCFHLRRLFESPSMAYWAHNAKYDANVLRAWTGVNIPDEQLHDTACVHHLLHENPPHGLDYLADIELHVGDYEAHVRNVVGHGKKRKSYDNIPDHILHPYGATDAECVYRLQQIYWCELVQRPHLLRLYQEETQPATALFRESEWTGVKISKSNLERLHSYYTRALEDILSKCKEIAGPTFNPGSHDQVKDFLLAAGFKKEIAAPASTKGYSTSKDTLLKISHPICPLILKYRNYQKMRSTYVENLLNDLQHDGRVRYGMRIHGTTSGRQACTIYHQIPRSDDELEEEAGAVLRALFEEDEDYEIVYGDFKQIEFFLLAYESGDKELIEKLEAGHNMHRISAASVLNIPVEECDDFNRSSVGKPFNFNVAYGGEGGQISKCKFKNPRTGMIEIVGEERAKLFTENYHKRHPRIREFQREVIETALCTGSTVRSRFGRERRLPELNSPDGPKQGHAEREAVNFKIQSPAASLTTRTMIEIRKWLRLYNIGPDRVRLLFPVHDAIIYGVHKDLVNWFKECFRSVAERHIPEYGKSFRMDIGVGRTWAEAEKNSKAK